jgi:hypothetical protein
MQARVRILLGLAWALAIFSALPASAYVRPVVVLFPDGHMPPAVHSAELRDPQRHNQLLEADLVIDATDNDGIERYEYRWNSATYGSVLSAEVHRPKVSYASIRPNTRYELELRAVDVHNNPSEWYRVWSGVTPGPPHVIVAGDSIASGYTKRWFTGEATCRDADLSYGTAVVRELAARLPDQWTPDYTNIAWAAAGVEEVLSGGVDSCGRSHPSQLDQIAVLAPEGAWNIVIMTAGINSTNWADVIVELTRRTVFSFTENGDRRACDLALNGSWNIESRRESITRISSILTESLSTNTNARVFWTGYYDITDTELAPMWSPIGRVCEAHVDHAMDDMHDAIRSGLSNDTTWVDIDKGIATQSWAGWPHPNVEGHDRIGRAIAESIND